MRRLAVPFLALLLGAAACDSGTTGPNLTVSATGTAIGVAFVDRNGNGALDPTDTPIPGVRVTLTPPGGTQAVASGVTNTVGLYVLPSVPVGSYHVAVDASTLGDSLQVSRIDTADITLGNRDTVRTTIAFDFPAVTTAQARQMTAGRKVQVVGIALNGWATFGDSSVAIADGSGTVRATRVAPLNLAAGDSVRIAGTTGTRDGQPVITAATATVLGSGHALPAPTTLTTAAAAGAGGGRYDAALVQIARSTILSGQVTSSGDLDLSIDDGSGVLHVILTSRAFNGGLYSVGAQLAATGVLVPATGGGSWVLRPRADADLQASFLSVTTATARTLPVGRQVQIVGLALNGWATFGDSTVHVLDATGALRAVRVIPASLFAGDSIRLVGTIASRDGQTILSSVSATVLAAGRTLPDPAVVTTAVASAARGGKDDAAAVRIVGGAIKDTLTLPNGDYRLHLDDGSGPLEVILDRDLGLRLSPYLPGVVLDLTGVLVIKTGGAAWQLKPRSVQDITVH